MNIFRRLTMIGSLALLLIPLAGCGSGGGAAGPGQTEEPELHSSAPSEQPAEPTAAPYSAPLTGLGMDEPAEARPVAVMINNLKPARPQSGLTEADVVWEVLAEGGITRLVAIFQSTGHNTEPIGPIRSIRPYLIELGESYGAVLAHAGGSNDAYAILQGQDKPYLDEITNAGGSFWRSKERKAPHNLYSDLEKLRAAADKKGYDSETAVPSYTFEDEGATAGGAAADNVSVTFSLQNYVVKYAYDAEGGVYKRFIGDEPHVDMNNDEQLTASNLVVLSASHRTLDNEGRLAIDLEQGGPAVLMQRGKAVECEWIRDGGGMIRIVKDGEELPMVPGRSFFHIVPDNKPLAEHVTYGS
ncbi:DUF3048 domain-containing protein [Paenibacillus thailandensis]|uniref:DUF3048 domain-containing protein n=1 Tax=Paenibacillus thailandensis TaxID=393250 RepID=A0ABW5QZB8_9BACL